jgi:single-strand DNA-binding protein
MSKDLNKVMITGRLGADPEMRYTAQGNAVTTFHVAAGRSWKDADRTSHDETEWFRVVTWNKLAEVCNEYLQKGDRVYIEGRLQTRKWTDKDGQDRYTSEVIANDMIMLSSKQGRSTISTSAADAEEQSDFDTLPPRPPSTAPAAPARSNRKRGANANAAARRAAAPTTAQPRGSFEAEDLPF